MKTTISRNHAFENRITLVRKSWKFYTIHHEKGLGYTVTKRTPELDAAFDAENWEAFEAVEAREFNGRLA